MYVSVDYSKYAGVDYSDSKYHGRGKEGRE